MWPFEPDVKKLAQRGNVRGLVRVLCRKRASPLDRIEAAFALAAAGTEDAERRLQTVIEEGLKNIRQYFDSLGQYWTKGFKENFDGAINAYHSAEVRTCAMSTIDKYYTQRRSTEDFDRVINAALSAALSIFSLSAMDKHRLAAGANPIRQQIDAFIRSGTDSEFLVGAGAKMLGHYDIDRKIILTSLMRYRWDSHLEIDRKLQILHVLALFSGFIDKEERALKLFICVCLDALLLPQKNTVVQWVVAHFLCTDVSMVSSIKGLHEALLKIAPELWRYDIPVNERSSLKKEISHVLDTLRKMYPQWVAEVGYEGTRCATVTLLEWVRRNRSYLLQKGWR